ncbi:MAG: TrkH family potassium uptake protein [Proteobacteria bacterium]|nr:TrkH family potassium uptake protein [Pseudomonadota bacterium]
MDLRPVYTVMGVLLIFLAGAMVLPAIADAQAGNPDWRVFASTGMITLYSGVGLWLIGGKEGVEFSIRHALIMVTLIWIVLPAVGALPFALGQLDLSFTDAYFEAVSGITTTGSTILTNLDTLPPGILLWRGILQWLGGLGIIVMAISLLPMLEIGGMQMFRVEAFETFGKASPRMQQVSLNITIVFALLTFVLFVALKLAGMNSLDAVVHAMTTIATAGYSNYDDSVGHFDSAVIDALITAGMFLAGIPFVLYVKAFAGNVRSLVIDEQVRLYTKILLFSVLSTALWLWSVQDFAIGQSLRLASFNIVSIMTGTGYVTSDYGNWGGFPVLLVIGLTFLGGCAGSTCCGVKVFRVQIVFKAAAAQVRQMIYPNGMFRPTFNGRPVDAPLVVSVASVLFAFLFGFILLAGALTLTGLDLETSLSGAATAISNVGPALGDIIGPTGNFQPLPDSAKWLLIIGMLLGRLEFLTFLTLINPLFWRK